MKAAIAGATPWREHGELPLKAEDTCMHHRDAKLYRRIIQCVPRLKGVGAVDDEIYAIQQRCDVLGGEHVIDRLHYNVWIECANLHCSGLHLQHPNAISGVDHLTLQVRCLYRIEVDDAQLANASRRKIERRRCAESTSAHHQHA